MDKILKNKIFQIIGAACQVYLGLGWLGIVGGWANIDSLFARIGGILLLITGIISFIGVFKKNI